MQPLKDCIIEALRNRDENEIVYVEMLKNLPASEREVFHIRLLTTLFSVVKPDEFKTACAMILSTIEKPSVLSGDPKMIN